MRIKAEPDQIVPLIAVSDPFANVPKTSAM
jgi:hypothetical protein